MLVIGQGAMHAPIVAAEKPKAESRKGVEISNVIEAVNATNPPSADSPITGCPSRSTGRIGASARYSRRTK